jgi:hypothetical protein
MDDVTGSVPMCFIIHQFNRALADMFIFVQPVMKVRTSLTCPSNQYDQYVGLSVLLLDV